MLRVAKHFYVSRCLCLWTQTFPASHWQLESRYASYILQPQCFFIIIKIMSERLVKLCPRDPFSAVSPLTLQLKKKNDFISNLQIENIVFFVCPLYISLEYVKSWILNTLMGKILNTSIELDTKLWNEKFKITKMLIPVLCTRIPEANETTERR